MILSWMFEEQYKLDEHIAANNNKKLTFEDKKVAAIVELGEMANEIRWFKKWSKKGISEKEIILEEAIDCLHFLLSIGNDYDCSVIRNQNYTVQPLYKGLSHDFLTISHYIISLEKDNIDTYMYILDYFLSFLYKLGFNQKDIEDAYIMKNRINHERQNNNY